MKCCVRRGGAGDVRDEYAWWRRQAFFYLGLVLVLGWAGLRLRSAGIEYRSRYDREFHTATIQKQQAQDALRSGCHDKPAGYKTVVMDCDKARLLGTSDPASIAHEVAWKHLVDDDLSIGSIIGNCHEGQCNGMLYRFGEALLNNIRLLLTLVVVVFMVVGGLMVFVLTKCWTSRKEMVKVLRWTSANPTNVAQTKFLDGMQAELNAARMLQTSMGTVRDTAVNLYDTCQKEHRAHEGQEVHVDTMMHTSAAPTPRKGYRMSDSL
jgi:hypothetical protein